MSSATKAASSFAQKEDPKLLDRGTRELVSGWGWGRDTSNHRDITRKYLGNILGNDWDINIIAIFEGSLEVKLPTIWTDEKQSRAEGERRERLEERRSEKRKSQKKEDADARKGRKVAKHCVFPMICGSGGSKSRLAKAAGAEPAGQMRDEKLHAVVA